MRKALASVGLGLVLLIFTPLAYAQEGPRSRSPFNDSDMRWAEAILFPPTSHAQGYCYERSVIQTLSTRGPEPLLKRVVEVHAVVWGRGKDRVEFYTPMGLTLEACARLGPDLALSTFRGGFTPTLRVYGFVRSMDQLNGWRASLVLRDARDRPLVELAHYKRYPFFSKVGEGFEGHMTFTFWSQEGRAANGVEAFLEALGVAADAYTIEFRVARGGKTEVYRIRYLDYPNLW